MATNRTRQEVEREITDTLGQVPGMFESMPDEFLDQEWQIFQQLELGETRIPNKYKELMGVALHSYTKCTYCTLFHTELARLFGATDAEIQEAVHYSKMSTGWSTYLNGMRVDFETFERELEEIGQYVRNRM
ncbi:MAG: carboxymuconolactone decarboxylase family protein [Myxococcota bacterium]